MFCYRKGLNVRLKMILFIGSFETLLIDHKILFKILIKN
jgi:hypothetical protein